MARMSNRNEPSRAIRARVSGRVQGVGYREATRRRARELGVTGWVRNVDDGTVAVHAEGPRAAVQALVAFLCRGPRGAAVEDLAVEDVPFEGHEQFAVRGVSAGVFVVQQHAASALHFDLRLQLGSAMRSWAVPKGPSLDPAVKRLAVQVEDHELAHNSFEGRTENGGVVVWDRGPYEQGGRAPWPAALERGHAVFVLHGEKLRGGFALPRTRPPAGAAPPGGEAVVLKSQWLLIKRRDEYARPHSDIAAEAPASVLSGLTLERLLRERP
jgi:DNA ligase D-like protein (predicted 3'-phosphoesterase)